MALTEEQKLIVGSKAHALLVSAAAGTGKTYTLVEYARARPSDRMIYLAFNRAIKEEASRKFPRNVSCKTIHGLAFAAVGQKYSHKLDTLKAHHVQKLGGTLREGGLVVEIINNFLASADLEILPDHLENLTAAAENKPLLLEKAIETWAIMRDPGDPRVPVGHDGYLKIFQIGGHEIRTDTILLDEAQDCTPCTLAIVSAQPARKVYVGDANQSIYGFRGAINAMANIRAEQHLYLTGSFRFGEGIADLANTILGAYSPHPKKIRGLGAEKTVFNVDEREPHTRLCRTNATLFGEAVSLLKQNRRFGFVGGVTNYHFDSIMDAYQLRFGSHAKIKDKMIQTFLDFEEMRGYAETLDDKELKSLCRIVDSYAEKIPSLITDIQEKACPDDDPSVVLLTTAHRSKGREWNQVVLTDDFTEMEKKITDTGEMEIPDQEEINLLYVAVTRAKRAILLPPALASWRAGQKPVDYSSEPPAPAPPSLPQEDAIQLPAKYDWLLSLAQRLDSDTPLPPEMRQQAAKYLRALYAGLSGA